jgi:hypothetical protein
LLAKAKVRRGELAACAGAARPLPTVDRVTALRAAPATPKPALPTAALTLEARPAEAPPRSNKRTVCTVAAGSTLALAVTGLGLGVAAWVKASDVEERGVWDPETQREDARGRAFADASVATLVAAGVAGLVAGTSCWLAWRDGRYVRPAR